MRQTSTHDRDQTNISVLVADDHPLVRFGVQNLLAGQPGVEVVGESASYDETRAAVRQLSPDLVLLDLEMKDATGTEAVEKLRSHYPEVNIIVYTGHAEQWLVVQSIRHGVRGYVLKESSNECLRDAVQTVARGGIYLDPAVTELITEQLTASRESSSGAKVDALTDRETIILGHIACGKRNREIAETLFISERTVKYHVTSMLAKLRARNRAEAVRIASARRLIAL